MKRILALCMGFWLAGALPGAATTFIEQPFPNLVQDAENIVRGKTGSSHADYAQSEDGAKRIYTFYELRVQEIFKGSVSGSTVLMRELGGEKDGRGMQVPGSAHFQSDEDVVVFLGPRNGDGSHDLRGMMMAKFNLKRDDDGREYLVGPGISSGAGRIVHPEDAAAGQGDTGVKKWTLEALRELVRAQGQAPDVKTPPPASSPTPRMQSPAAPAPSAPPADSLAAPQLQPPSPEEGATPPERFPSWALLALGGGVLAAAAWFLLKKPRP
jgi:hypothetical protein